MLVGELGLAPGAVRRVLLAQLHRSVRVVLVIDALLMSG